MKVVFFLKGENFSKVKGIVESDEIVSRQSITFREARSLGMEKDGYYLLIEGSEASINKARELLKEVADEVGGEEKEKIEIKVKEEEKSATEGFGNIFS